MNKKNTPSTHDFAKDALRYIPAQCIPPLIGFLALAFYTRALTPTQYGQYILVLTTVTLTSALIFSWINQSCIRYFQDYSNNNQKKQFITTSIFSLFSLLAFTLVCWLCGIHLVPAKTSSDARHLFSLGGLLLFSQTGYTFMLILLRADRKSTRYSLYSVVNSLGVFLLAAFLIKIRHRGPEAIILSMALINGTIMHIELSMLTLQHQIQIAQFSPQLLKKMAAYGLPMIGVAAGALILSVSDRYMIQYYLNTDMVGIYTAGYTLTERSVQGIAGILMLSASPVIFQTFARSGNEETSILIGRMTGVYLTLLIPAVLGISALARDISTVILGEPFHTAAIVLPWIAGGIFFHELGFYFNAAFQLREKTRLLLYTYIAAALLNILLNILWIPRHGILGAAYATFCAYLAYAAVTFVLGNMLFPLLFPWKTLFKTSGAAIIMSMVICCPLINLPTNILTLALKIIVGALCYFICLTLFREEALQQACQAIRNKFIS